MSTNNSQRSGFLGYDLFKLIVALVLLIILILLLLRSCSSSSVSAVVTEEAATQTNAAMALPHTPEAGITANSPVITSPQNGDHVPGLFTLLGTSQPGSQVLILIVGTNFKSVVQTVTADSSGNWSAQLDMDEGPQTLVAAVNPQRLPLPSNINDIADSLLLSNQIRVNVVLMTPTATFEPTSTTEPTNTPLTSTPAVASDGAGCDGLISGYLLDEEHYVVGSCDTLSGIAIWLEVSVESLLESNPQITDPDTIIPGQIVNVPPK